MVAGEPVGDRHHPIGRQLAGLRGTAAHILPGLSLASAADLVRYTLADDATLLSCAFCGKAAQPHTVGDRESRAFAEAGSAWGRELPAANKVFFASADQARVAGYEPRA